MIVGNEPNLDTFWQPQFGAGGRDLAAVGYADLLARSYDAIKAADPGVRVLGGALAPRGADRPRGSRPTHSPTAFIRDLGAAYRATGRKRPLMDAFAFHPYMQASRVSPTRAAPEEHLDHDRRLPEAGRAPRRGVQGDRAARRAPAGLLHGVRRADERPASQARLLQRRGVAGPPRQRRLRRQAAYYRRALALAYCQPTVRGIFVFHTFDEPDFAGWQSGLYFADRTPKPSLPAFKQAVSDLRNGKLVELSSLRFAPWPGSTSRTRSSRSIPPGAGSRSRSAAPGRTPSPRPSRTGRAAWPRCAPTRSPACGPTPTSSSGRSPSATRTSASSVPR